MKLYDVIKDFWRNGVLVEAGSVVTMTENEVKYLKHAVADQVAKAEAVVAKVEAAVTAAVVGVKATEAKVLGAVASEAPANGNASK
jgi:hypothetical protein